MQTSWDATGKILPIWQQLDGPAKREQLAELSDVRPTELSAHNTGKPLGRSVAQKIIDGAAKAKITVTLADLGEPEAVAAEEASIRQIKRWEQGGHPTRSSALDLEAATGYPARLFLPPAEPTLAEIGAKLDLIISMLDSKNGKRG